VGQLQAIATLLSQGKWTGQEAARLILSAADDLSCGREPVFTEAEAARLRHGLSPEDWREYVWWVEGWLLLQDFLLPAGRIALLEATRALLAAEVTLTRVLDLALYRRKNVDAVAAWTSSARTLLGEVQRYTMIRGRTLVWLAAGADVFRAALGLTTLPSGTRLQALIQELEEAVAHTRELLTLLKVLDIDLPELPALETLGPEEAALQGLERRMRAGRSGDWPTLWAWWMAQAEALPAQP
jgi:hypothetical protein